MADDDAKRPDIDAQVWLLGEPMEKSRAQLGLTQEQYLQEFVGEATDTTIRLAGVAKHTRKRGVAFAVGIHIACTMETSISPS